MTLVLMLLVTAAISNTLPGASAPDRTRIQTGHAAGPVQLIPVATRTLLDHTSLLPATAKRTSDKHAGLISTGIRFQENRGQIIDTRGKLRPEIAFVANTPGAKLYFRNDGISTVFTKTVQKQTIDLPLESVAPQSDREETEMQYYRLDMKLVGGNPFARVRAHDELPGYVNFYLGHCPDGITGVREFSRIVYEHVYDNIDLEILSIDGKMKYNFIVRPGGNVSDIRMKYDGALETAIMAEGSLHVATPLGHIEEATPYTYVGHESNHVPSSFVRDGNTVSFEVGAYDPTETLIIDPWATYYGGSGDEVAYGIATDGNNNVIVSGGTWSANFPITTGAFQTALAGTSDAFILKFDASGTRLWATYYGGSGGEVASGVTTNSTSDVVITGQTTSPDFPVMAGAFQTTFGGNGDAFIVKLNDGGTRLWATFVGGSGNENGGAYGGVATDENDNIIITGTTGSGNFPVTSGAFQITKGNGNTVDIFVSKFNGSGNQIWGTYCGGTKNDGAFAIAVFGSDIYVTGSTTGNFPVSPGAFQTTYAGDNVGGDAFLIKFSGSGTRIWATYYGGSAGERGHAVSVDGTGNVFIAGYTFSSNFPVSAGAFQTVRSGNTDAFIAKFNASGARQWATLYGGGSSEYAFGLACDSYGNVIISGTTLSIDFPVSAAFQASHGGGSDVTVLKMDANGTPIWATYYGGSANEGSWSDVDVDANGNVILTAWTSSSDFPVYNPQQQSTAGGQDAFVVSLNSSGLIPGYNASPVAVASATPAQGIAPLFVSFSSSGSYDPDGTITGYHWDFGDNNTSTSADPSHTYTNPGVYTAVLTVTDNNNATGTATVTITVNSANSYVYVFDQTVTRIQAGSNKWKGSDVVTIYDGLDQPVSGALVTASFSGPNSGTVIGTTGANGTVTLQTSQKTNPGGIWCFTVTNVQATGFTFNASIGEVTSCEGTPKVSAALPTSIDVSVYPNPFNPTTTISYGIPKDGYVLLRVFDVHGHIVTELVNEEKQAGTYTFKFEGSNLPSGFYLYRLEANSQTRVGRMMLMK